MWERKNPTSKDTSQDMKANQMLIKRQMNKEAVLYTQLHAHTHTHTHTMGYYTVTKKNENLLFTTIWMDLRNFP